MNIIFAIPRQFLGIVCLVTCTLSVAQVHFDVQSIESSGDEYFLSDFNGDGGIDVITRDGPAVFMALGSFTGEFGEPWQILDLSLELDVDDYSGGMEMGDINGDGQEDLLMFQYLHYSQGFSDYTYFNYVLNQEGFFATGLNRDSLWMDGGRFDSRVVADISDGPEVEIVGVRTNEYWGGDGSELFGHYDVVVANLQSDELFESINQGSFSSVGSDDIRFWVHDLNNDGKSEIITISYPNWPEIMIGGDVLRSSIVREESVYGSNLCFVQLDGTGPDEFIALSNYQPQVWWLNASLDSIDSVIDIALPKVLFAEAADFEQSSASEEMLYYQDSLLMMAHFKTNGTVDFIDTIDSGMFSDLTIIDMDHDGDMDFAIYKNGELNSYKNAEILAISETAEVQFEVYPNPASVLLKIESKEAIDAILLYSQDGLLVLENENSQELLIQDLKPSMYIMEVQFENGSVSRKKIFKN